jgi:RimJ/RimL family protein N-acetyltransferase
LRPLKKPAPRNLAWLRDPEVMRYSEQRHQTHTLSTQLAYVSSFRGKSHLWGIYRVDTGNYIGNLSARHDDPNDVTDVGIMIGEPGSLRQGLGREAWMAACDWLLNRESGNVRKLEAGCMKSNEAMLRIIRGSKFVQEGELPGHFLLKGNPESAMLFGRIR